MRVAPVAADNPKIVCIIKDDLCFADRRKTQQEWSIRLSPGYLQKCRDEGERQHRKELAHVTPKELLGERES
jgi:hypothetical protein